MVNKKFKSSVFTTLFEEPSVLRELYCALKDVTLPPDVPVLINTLENVLFMGKINDISFEIDGKLIVLIEHQSTINPNMALRLLIYIAHLYERNIKNKNVYSSARISIPRPEFFILYNGIEPYPEEETVRLSDLFKETVSLGLPENAAPMLELEARVFNINDGRNAKISGKCKKLAEYSAFIAKERELYKITGNKEESVKAAIEYCEKHDILKELLLKHAAEVLNMSLLEWTVEDALSLAREEGIDEGIEKGIEKGRVEGQKIILDLLTQGFSIDEIKQRLEEPV